VKIKIKLDAGAKMPTRAHDWDAGLDIYSRETKTVPARGSADFDTGVHIELPIIPLALGFGLCVATVGMLKSKSGLNVKHGITSEGVIDVGYTGSIRVKLYNHSDCDYEVKEGDKISQLVIMPILTPNLIEVAELDAAERGDNGFGSSGR
jgi:dUTP pyrophosphatase